MDDWHVDLAVAGPQKCLAGPPGMSLISVSDRAWEAMESNPSAPRGSFLSLLDWKHKWIDGGRVAFPYTPSVSDVNGVNAAGVPMASDSVAGTAPPAPPSVLWLIASTDCPLSSQEFQHAFGMILPRSAL